MKLHISHHTHYRYSESLFYAIQSLHLTPQSGPTQTVVNWDVKVGGALFGLRDGVGNWVQTYSRMGPATEASVRAQGVVQSLDVAIFDEPLGLHPSYFLSNSPLAHSDARMTAWAKNHIENAAVSAQTVLALACAVSDRVAYRPGSTEVETLALEAFDWEAGVCQDQAHVMVAMCRGLGWPARYVSGYFGEPDAPELASHAWVDVCVDTARQRWVSVDITHHCLTDQRHVRLAVGADYSRCAPIRGVRQGGGEESMEVDLRIDQLID
jgi:transglutaminase-like putative cysteine protease